MGRSNKKWLHRSQNQMRSEITLDAESTLPDGWMPGGWGSYRFRFRNGGSQPARVARWAAHWEARGEPVGQPWSADLALDLPAGSTITKDEIGFLPIDVVEAARPDHPVMVGSFRITQAGDEIELPFRIAIPGATLSEALVLLRGERVGVRLQRSRVDGWTGGDRALRWLDQAYAAMSDLTGVEPYGGALLTLDEAPPNPYYAYAGNPIVLNTRHVGGTLAEIAAGQMPFGWIHEIGHCFDVRGAWYNWSAIASEWQANWKLAYAFEQIEGDWTIDWRKFRNPSFEHGRGDRWMRGSQFVDALFTTNGDAYLADPTRTWQSLTSDELHSLFQRIQRVYGWEPFRRWYRVYDRLAAAGSSPPGAVEDKIALAVAILERATEADLLPTFKRWRFPITRSTIDAQTTSYRLDRRVP